MNDIVERAKAALEGVTEGPWTVDPGTYHLDDDGDSDNADVDGPNGGWIAHCQDLASAEFIAAARTLVPELVAEVERLRAGGPWVEHVERMKAMKRERDGDCICDGNQETTDGPDEFCPWHGRGYRELVEILDSQAAELERLQRFRS